MAETTVGTAQGTRIAARTKPRPRNGLLMTIAIARPMERISIATETRVKKTVWTKSDVKPGSLNNSA